MEDFAYMDSFESIPAQFTCHILVKYVTNMSMQVMVIEVA